MDFNFGTLFGHKNPALLGLDISTSGIRLVELSEVGKNMLQLERYASEVLPRGAVVDGNIENLEQVAEAIQRALKKSSTRTRHVALGMPSASVITKKIILPAGSSEDELELQVENEASQYIPFSLDEVSLDFDVLGPAENAPDEIEVLLAATRKEKVEDRVAVAQTANLTPVVMDIESFAAHAAINRLIAAMPKAGEGKIVALFRIGAHLMHVSMLLDGQVVYEREQPFGGNQLTQDIVRAYGLNFEQAELKKRADELPDGYERELFEPFLETAGAEVTRAIQFFFTATPHTRIDQIFLAGGCAVMDGLVEAVAMRTKTPCAVVNPFQGMQFAAGVREKQLQLDAPAYLVACGLALRRFDK